MIKIVTNREQLSASAGLRELAIDATINGAESIATEEGVVTYNIFDGAIDLATAGFVVSEGAEVADMPLWIEVTSKTANVPAGLVGATITEEDDTVTTRTWEDWKKSNHTFYEADGKIYIGTNAHTGKHLPLSELSAVATKLVTANQLPVEEVTTE